MELSQNPKSKIQNGLLLSIGIIIRFWLEFLAPAFSGDEINLGNNIKHRGFLELLAPLDNFQSAPPLYLWLQKVVISISPFDFWISIKLVSFIVSVAVLFQVAKLSRSLFENIFAQVLFLSFFVLSPSVLYHTLTVKQYGFDLLFLLFALNHFNRLKDTYAGPALFAVWCMFSNIGLFFAAAMGIYKLISYIRHTGVGTINRFVFDPKNILLGLSPIPYVLYFSWFMRQPGAAALKEYMLGYWAWTFIPLDGTVFRYFAYLFDDVAFYFVSPNRAISYALLVVAIAGIFPMFTRQGEERRRLVAFLIFGGLVHAVLSAMKMFPVSERLYLYESPLMYIFLVSGVTLIFSRFATPALIVVTVVLAGINVMNIPFKQNDIVSMYRYLQKNGISDVVYSERAFNDVRSFNEFTDSAFGKNDSVELFDQEGDAEHVTRDTGGGESEAGSGKGEGENQNPKSKTQNGRYVISRSHVEFRHQSTLVEEEDQIVWLLRSGRLRLVYQTQGYKLYEIR